ncbi:MAG: hypothetical protein AAF514_14520, partial [Verrucomicrobiota bacterium]
MTTLALLFVLLFVFFLRRGGDGPDQNEYHEVKRGEFLVSIVEGGTLEAVSEEVVRNEVDGESRIIFIVPEGTTVKKGDLVVELDSAEADDELNQQQISYEKNLAAHVAAENDLTIMESTVQSETRVAELAVKFAFMDLKKFEEIDREQQIRSAEIEIITAKEALKIAEEKLQWSEEL